MRLQICIVLPGMKNGSCLLQIWYKYILHVVDNQYIAQSTALTFPNQELWDVLAEMSWGS
jgi:hypothetical protein